MVAGLLACGVRAGACDAAGVAVIGDEAGSAGVDGEGGAACAGAGAGAGVVVAAVGLAAAGVAGGGLFGGDFGGLLGGVLGMAPVCKRSSCIATIDISLL